MDGERDTAEMRYGIRERKMNRESGNNHMRDEIEGEEKAQEKERER